MKLMIFDIFRIFLQFAFVDENMCQAIIGRPVDRHLRNYLEQ